MKNAVKFGEIFNKWAKSAKLNFLRGQKKFESGGGENLGLFSLWPIQERSATYIKFILTILFWNLL